MSRLSLTVPAEKDMIELWVYIGRDNPLAADRIVERLNKTFNLLAQFPGLGERFVHRNREMRRLSVSSFAVFYQHLNGEVTIMRVLHAARQWEDLV
jgi:toxin ParE1/3/4